MKLFPIFLLVFAASANGSDALPSKQDASEKSQKDAVEAIEKIGGKVRFDKSGRVIAVVLMGHKVTDASLVHLKELTGMKTLYRGLAMLVSCILMG